MISLIFNSKLTKILKMTKCLTTVEIILLIQLENRKLPKGIMCCFKVFLTTFVTECGLNFEHFK